MILFISLLIIQAKKLDDEQKQYFSKLMSKMIIVDDDINANELAIYSVVQDFCNIKQSFEENLTEAELDHCLTSE